MFLGTFIPRYFLFISRKLILFFISFNDIKKAKTTKPGNKNKQNALSSRAITTLAQAKKVKKKLKKLIEFEFKIFLKIMIKIGNVNIAIFIGPVSCKKRKINGKYNKGNNENCHFRSKDLVNKNEKKTKKTKP